jgi:hypothetical protein
LLTGDEMKSRFLAICFAAALSATAGVSASQAQGDGAQTQTPAEAPSTVQGRQDGPRQSGDERGHRVFGKISALHPDSIEVTGLDGTKVSVKLTSSTEFRRDRQPAKMSDFKVGDAVMVRTDQAVGDGAVTALMVAAAPSGGFAARGEGRGAGGGQVMMQGTMGKDYVVGEVKSVDAPKLTVLRVDNVTQTLELNEDTSLRRGRESITMADIQPGDHIFSRGAVANGVFVPKGVNVIPPEQWQRMQEMMSQGGEQRGGNSRGAPSAPSAPPPPAQNPPEQRN